MKVPVTVNDLLDGQVGLDLECLDRIYLNGYVPTLQTSGQVASFLTVHLGNSIPSPALFEKIGTRFRADVRDHAAQIGAEWIVFRKGDRKLDVVRPLLDKAAKEGRSRVVAVGVAQEFQYVTSAVKVDGEPGAVPRLAFGKAERRVTCFYFYLWDEEFGPAFIKICAYFPYPVKVWVNGHEWAKRQATWAGIGFTELSNGFATCDAPDRLQWLCDQLTPERIGRFVHEWLTDLVVTVLYLLRLRHDASDQPAGLGVALPPAARLAARPHAIAFPVWTFAIVSGAMWAESAWGRYWAGIRRRPGPSSVGCSTPRTCTPDIGLAARPHRRPTRLRRLGQHADQPLRSTC